MSDKQENDDFDFSPAAEVSKTMIEEEKAKEEKIEWDVWANNNKLPTELVAFIHIRPQLVDKAPVEMREFALFLQRFRREVNANTANTILDQPHTAKLPETPDEAAILTGLVVSEAILDDFHQIFTYARRLKTEHAIWLIRTYIKKCPEILKTKAFRDYVIEKKQEILHP